MFGGRALRRVPVWALTLVFIFTLAARVCAASFTLFESGPVRPLAMSPDGTRLFAVNIPDARLEIFDVDAMGDLTHAGAVPVGLEPVAVAARTNGEVWVVNQLSDSVSVVDVAASPPRVVRTLLVGDEPRDIVFAGAGRQSRLRHHGPPRPERSQRPAAHHGRRRPRRRLGVRRDQPRRDARRHAAHHPHPVRRHASRPRRVARRHARLRRRLPIRQSHHHGLGRGGVRRRQQDRQSRRRLVHHQGRHHAGRASQSRAQSRRCRASRDGSGRALRRHASGPTSSGATGTTR